MDISILRYLDVLIGFALVMALVSSFVTLLTQFILSCEKKRAKLLKQGIAALLKRADPTLAPHANEIAEMILQSGKAGVKREVIMREQLVRRLLEIVADTSPPDSQDGILQKLKSALDSLLSFLGLGPASSNPQNAKDALAKVLSSDASKDALATDFSSEVRKLLERIDHKICQLEVEHPEFASHVVHTHAIIEARAGKFIDAIMTRFDNMSESLTALFSAHSRLVTFLVSLLVALALPLDSIDLLQRLSTDNTMREALVTEAIKESASHDKAAQPTQPQELQSNIQSQAKVANEADQQPPISSAGLTPKAKSVKNNTAQPIKSGKATSNPKAKELEAGATITGNASNQQPTEPSKQATPPAVSNSNTPTEFEDVKVAWAKLNDPKLSLVSRGGWSKIIHSDSKLKDLKFDWCSFADWLKILKSGQVWETIRGCFLSALLMTIGAPFWFEVLKNLLKLRPSLAKTDDEAREKRRKDETTIQA